MAFEDDLGWEYFGADPMMSPRMQEHMDWHTDPQNKLRQGNYGERFLLFHKQYIEKFDVFRSTKSLLAVSGWDPSTPIPAALSHDHVLTSPRHTDNPFAVDPLCKTPTWATLAGGADHAPIYGYTRLSQFRSLDELGWSIDSGWHGRVHNTIGGDMAAFHSPIDPVFWRWHRWIDDIRATWVVSATIPSTHDIAMFVQILFGIINDGPGIWIGPDGRPHPWPGPGPDPLGAQLSPAMRDVLIGLAAQAMGSLVHQAEPRQRLEQLGVELARAQLGHLLDRV